MTHAESQDLLIDLAFGELDPARAAEVADHLAGCDECRREKRALDEARRLAAPLRELEEPGAAFDDRILAAAKAQAQLTHDGNIGQVIEVSGSVKPLGLTPSSIDAHGPVSVKAAERRRPRWMLRVALGGSVAAAAALALAVSTTLQSKHVAQLAAQKDDAYEIRVHAAEEATRLEAKAAAPKMAKAEPPEVANASKIAQLAQPAGPPPVQAPLSTMKPMKQERALAKKEAPSGLLGGSGGDSSLGAAGRGAGASNLHASDQMLEADERQASPPPAAPARRDRPALAHAPAAAESQPYTQAASAEPRASAAPPAVVSMARKEAATDSAESLEKRAEQARHAGNFALAAGLYRKAAAQRREEAAANSSAAAWDLAHAVECLAAAGQFDDAKRVRDELIKSYPSEDTAFYAAARALREVEAAPPAADSAKQ